MSPAWIRVRENQDGSKSYQVVFRKPGGRGIPIQSAGTFRGWPGGKKKGKPAAALTAAQNDAATRRDLVSGWLAQGLDPQAELDKLSVTATAPKTPVQWRDEWLVSRHDLAVKSTKLYVNGTDAILDRLDVARLDAITVPDCERIVGELVTEYSPATVGNYWQAFAQLLDYAGIDPNPARHKRIRLPKVKGKPPMPPTGPHLIAMLERVARKNVLPMAFIEQTAVRVETIELATWGSLDIAGCRVRVFEKGGKYRWVPVPRWLVRQIEATCPLEDRSTGRRLFPGMTSDGLRAAMARACVLARIPHYHPHDLRHRRASLWHLQGVPDRLLADWIGHEKASFSKDVYTHVIPVDEIPAERLEAIVEEALAA